LKVTTVVEKQFQSEILLCDAIAELIKNHDYSVYDVRAAVGAFTGEILGRMGEKDQHAADRLASPRLASAAGSVHLESRWAKHSTRYKALTV
jgi:hypothetical protein